MALEIPGSKICPDRICIPYLYGNAKTGFSVPLDDFFKKKEGMRRAARPFRSCFPLSAESDVPVVDPVGPERAVAAAGVGLGVVNGQIIPVGQPPVLVADETNVVVAGKAGLLRADRRKIGPGGVCVREGDPAGGEALQPRHPEGAGDVIGQEKYTSDAEGLVTVAYLANGVYTLSETGIPKGYQGLPGTLTINVNGSAVSIDGEESVLEMCELIVPGQDGSETGASDMPVITVKNKEMVLQAIKTGENQTPLSGAHFALYRQVMDGQGNLRKDYQPMSGYDDLVTGGDGLIPKITQELAAGTYYLTETYAPEEYEKLTEDILFTISSTGTVSVAENQSQLCTLASEVEEGTVTYTLTVINSKSIGYELPDCGGSGTNLIYLLGIMLTGLAGAGLMMQKRKKAA